MGEFKFIFPRMDYEEKAADYIQEFLDSGSPINGVGGLDYYMKKDDREGAYADWLSKIMRDVDIANIPEGRVPGFTYFFVRAEDDMIIGMINIRIALNDFLRKQGGHIGYSIRPSERGNGLATRMLREALKFCGAIGLSDIIITCGKANLASAGVIKNCGGVLDAEFYSEAFGEIIQRYIIHGGG